MSTHALRWSFLALPAIWTLIPAPATGADDAAAVNDILRTWRQRQDSVHSVMARWDSVHLVTQWEDQTPDHKRRLVTFPEFRAAFFIENGKIRYETLILHNDPDSRQSGPTPSIEAFDGTTESHFAQKRGTSAHHYGSKTHGVTSPRGYHNAHLFPLLFFYRPFLDGVLGTKDSSPFELIGEEEIGGITCQVMVRNLESQTARRLWVSSDQDRLPIRYLLYFDSMKAIHVDVTYKRVPGERPSPSEWTVTHFHNAEGDVMSRSTGKVVELAINTEFDDMLFSPRFPEGTRVYEKWKGQDSSRPPIDYVVQAAGEKLSPAEDALKASSEVSITRYVSIGVTLVLVVVLAIAVARQRMHG